MRVAAVVVLAGSLMAVACGSSPAPRPFAGTLATYRAGDRFAVVGDLQRTSLLEFWREQNDAERALIVQGIADSHPAFLAITGDMVFDGSSSAKWAAFDALMGPIHDAGIPAFAAFGNHEYWGAREEGEAHVFERFPHIGGKHTYTIAFGPLRLVFVDSNLDELTEEEWSAEMREYASSLAAIDGDPDARGALVLLHHPPYTNSTVTGDEAFVQTDLVPPFLASKKTLAMLSGHVHSYERFVRAGRTFVVSGGGGGPRAALATGKGRRHPDDQFQGPALRDFHFTLYEVAERGVIARVMGLPKGGRELRTMDEFVLPWPSR